ALPCPRQTAAQLAARPRHDSVGLRREARGSRRRGPRRTCRLSPGPSLLGSGVNSKEARVQELVQFLLKNLYLDFQGDITMEQIRQFLRQDDSREARRVLARILDEKGVDDLLLTLADCLREHLPNGVNEEVIRAQL